jgi:hypothetical protein
MEKGLEFIRFGDEDLKGWIDRLLYNYGVLNGIECCFEITPAEWNGLSSQQRKEVRVLNVLYETFAGLSILGV